MEKRRWSGKFFRGSVLSLFLLTMVIALPAWGQELDWAIQTGGSGRDRGYGIAVDREGNSYVTGSFSDIAVFGAGEANETELSSFGGTDMFVAKYGNNGDLLWVRQAGWSAGAADHDIGEGISVDETGNIYVTGTFSGTVRFGIGETNETELTTFGLLDLFVAKYANDGTLLWVKQAGGSDVDTGHDVDVDDEGNSYVTGVFNGTATFGIGEANETMLTDCGGGDIYVAKYASNGTLLWVKQAGSSDRVDGGISIAVDEAGNSYVTGSFQSTATFATGEANETTLTSISAHDVFVAKYASNGTLLWVKQAGNPGWAQGLGISLDEQGSIYVTGYFEGAITFGVDEVNETILSGFDSFFADDIFLAKYANDGNLLWARQDGGLGVGDQGWGVVADDEGNSYVVGIFNETATFGAGETNETELTAVGNILANDIFIAKYGIDGDLLWVTQIGGPNGQDIGEGIDVDDEGNSYVTGRYGDTLQFGSEEGNVTFLDSFGSLDIFVAKYLDDNRITSDIDSLIDSVEDFDLNKGIERSLLAKLRNTKKAIESGNADHRQNAVNILQAFINEVEAQRGKALTDEQTDQLIDAAWEIMAGI